MKRNFGLRLKVCCTSSSTTSSDNQNFSKTPIDQTISVLVIIFPIGTDRSLTANIPDIEGKAIGLHRLDVKSSSWGNILSFFVGQLLWEKKFFSFWGSKFKKTRPSSPSKVKKKFLNKVVFPALSSPKTKTLSSLLSDEAFNFFRRLRRPMFKIFVKNLQ